MKQHLSTKEITLFSVLGTIMFASKVIMEVLPNIHLLGMFIMTYTVVFRKKALIPIYIYVFLDGIYGGFGMWWVPYLYVWTVLWGVTMLLPQNMTKRTASIVYPIVCCCHGLLFGTLYAPAQALMMGMNLKATIAWIVSGLPFDLVHGVGNLFTGFLVLPLSELMKSLLRKYNVN